MALHPDFSENPYHPLVPSQRWFPGDDSLREKGYRTLIPPLVSKIREEVYKWRNAGYPNTSPTTKALLNWWFEKPHFIEHFHILPPFLFGRSSVAKTLEHMGGMFALAIVSMKAAATGSSAYW